jgi:hypothetical protein
VVMEEYKVAALGPTYYDSAAAVAAAVAVAAEEAARVKVTRAKVEQLVAIYNTYVPWVLDLASQRLGEMEAAVARQRGNGGGAGGGGAGEGMQLSASASTAAQQECARIVQMLDCLALNVEEASTFLGKVGRTREGAHDAGEIELASSDVQSAASSRRAKAKRTGKRAGGGGRATSDANAQGGGSTALAAATTAAPGATAAAAAVPQALAATVFFQKQRGAFCGVCALNNMLGWRAVSYREAELLADSIWLKSLLSHGCGIHFPAPRLHSRRREFPYDGFIDFTTMHKLCQMHGIKLRELSRIDVGEVVGVMRRGLAAAAATAAAADLGAGSTSRTRRQSVVHGGGSNGNALPLLFVLLGAQKHYICLCARRAEAAAEEASAPFPSWNRSILTEIYLCHACSGHESEGGNGAPGAGGWRRRLGRHLPLVWACRRAHVLRRRGVPSRLPPPLRWLRQAARHQRLALPAVRTHQAQP